MAKFRRLKSGTDPHAKLILELKCSKFYSSIIINDSNNTLTAEQLNLK